MYKKPHDSLMALLKVQNRCESLLYFRCIHDTVVNYIKFIPNWHKRFALIRFNSQFRTFEEVQKSQYYGVGCGNELFIMVLH